MTISKAAVTELATTLLLHLDTLRSLGINAYPLTLRRLVDMAAPTADPEVVAKVLGVRAFTERIVFAQKKAKFDSPIAFGEDADRLAESDLVLEFALGQICTPDRPSWPLATVAKRLDPPLRQVFLDTTTTRMAIGKLPATVGKQKVKSVDHLYLSHLPPPPPPVDPVAKLRANLLLVLSGQKQLGVEGYPLSLDRLLALTEPDAPAAVVKKALAGPIFRGLVLLAVPKDPATPVALTEDAAVLADSPLLLEFLAESVCTDKKRSQPLPVLAKKLTPELQPLFVEAVGRRISSQSLPATVGVVPATDPVQLYLRRLPPLATRPQLIEALLSQLEQSLVGVLADLVAATGLAVPPAVMPKALKAKPFKDRVIVVFAGDPASPVALAEHASLLFEFPGTLEYLVRKAAPKAREVTAVKALSAGLDKRLAAVLPAAVLRHIEANTLPPQLDYVLLDGNPLLYLRSNLNQLPNVSRLPVEPTMPAPTPVESFPAAFDAAFHRLDRQAGGHNSVSLFELRAALPTFDRPTFDRALHDLRRSSRYSLRTAEGFAALRPEERAAAVVEEGALLLYVSRTVS